MGVTGLGGFGGIVGPGEATGDLTGGDGCIRVLGSGGGGRDGEESCLEGLEPAEGSYEK